MTPRTEARAGDLRRLHPSSLLFMIGGTARSFLLPAILLLLFSARSSRNELLWAVFFLPAAGLAVAHYFSYSYRFGEKGLVVRAGIFTRSERDIPYARIQNVDVAQNPLQRLLRVAEVRLETASGKEAEAKLEVVSLDAVEEIRERVFRERRAAGEVADADVPEAERGRTLLHLGAGELVLLGLLSNRGFAMVAAAIGLLWQFDVEPEEHLERWVRENGEGAWDRLTEIYFANQVLFAVTGVLAALVLMRVLTVVWALLRYHGFTLKRVGDDLRLAYGLFTRVLATVPRQRVQVVSVRESRLQRLAGRARVRAHTAGGAGTETPGGRRADLAPIARRPLVADLVAEVQPALAPGFAESLAAWPLPAGWSGLHPRARTRIFRRHLIFWGLVLGVAAWFWTPWVLAVAVPLTPWWWFSAGRRARADGWRLDEHALWVRIGWFGRYTEAVPFSRIQSVRFEQDLLDRRWKMAEIAVDTAGTGASISLDLLPEDEARELARRLDREAARHVFRWN